MKCLLVAALGANWNLGAGSAQQSKTCFKPSLHIQILYEPLDMRGSTVDLKVLCVVKSKDTSDFLHDSSILCDFYASWTTTPAQDPPTVKLPGHPPRPLGFPIGACMLSKQPPAQPAVDSRSS